MKKRLWVILLSTMIVMSFMGCKSSSSSGSNTTDPEEAKLESIEISPAHPSIALGYKQSFSATGHYSDGTTQALTSVQWSSSGKTIATINESTGLATSVAEGGTTITASLNGVTGSTSLTVTPAVLQSISVTPQNVEILPGQIHTFTATGNYSNGSTEDLTTSVAWSSSQPLVASIVNGQATAVNFGETNITASDETSGLSDTATLTVSHGELESVEISPLSPTIGKGETINFTATGRYEDGTEEDITTSVTWSSSNAGAASIDERFGSAQGLSTVDSFSIITATVPDTDISAHTTLSVCKDGTVVYDNDLNTTADGSWAVSTAAGPYGAESLVTKHAGTFTWTFTPTFTGEHEIYIWWTSASTRRVDVPVAITHDDGTATDAVDQTQDGSDWIGLGTYRFTAGEQYTVTITAIEGELSTCADAMKTVEYHPVAVPQAGFHASVTSGLINTVIRFFDDSIDSLGTIVAWLWNFGDGATSTAQNPQHTYTEEGSYNVSLTVKNDKGVFDTLVRYAYVNIFSEREDIYICDGFDGGAPVMDRCEEVLTTLGATFDSGIWVYTDHGKGVTYFIHEVTTPAGMKAALKTQDAHIIFNGHSNYGLGATFTRTDSAQKLVRYVDDDLIVNTSTDMVPVSLNGLIFGQAYPNLKPIYKDGGNAIMPYDFGDPSGPPPYNYYLTYKVPGDNTLYFIERPDGSRIERFDGCKKPAWAWPRGENVPPNPDIASERQYFITNPAPEYNHFSWVGTWNYAITPLDAYRSYNYQYRNAGGSGLVNIATWTIVVNTAGNYEVRATWYFDTGNATNAKYTINHAGGSTIVYGNMRTAPAGVALKTLTENSLGTYYFNVGVYTVTLCDGADGKIIADTVALYSVDSPPASPSRIRVDNTDLYQYHYNGGYYGQNTILNLTGKTVPTEQLKYKRMLYSSCFSGRYFLGKFHQGQMFFTLEHTGGWDNPVPEYLRRYLIGQTDEQIDAWFKTSVPIYDYYNFDLIPPSMR